MAEGAGFGEGNTRSDSLDCLGVNVFTELVSVLGGNDQSAEKVVHRRSSETVRSDIDSAMSKERYDLYSQISRDGCSVK